MADQITWPGKSGTRYTYFIYPIGTEFSKVPGNYIFAKETTPGSFIPIYIGQTGDLSERFDNHHKLPCIRNNRATHIHAHKSSQNESARLVEEADLVQKWTPTCNT